MNPDDVIKQLELRPSKRDSIVEPEMPPARLLGVFRDKHKVQEFTDGKETWLLFDSEYMVLERKL
jgi:hypothetical protein